MFLLVVGSLMMISGAAGLVAGVPLMSLLIFGALVLLGTLFDMGYRGGAGRTAHGATWQPTGEREINSLTGVAEEVWFDPITGARRYEPLGSDPNIN